MSRWNSRLVFAVCMLANLVTDWLDLHAVWTIPIGIASMACAIMIVAEGQTRADRHISLNLNSSR